MFLIFHSSIHCFYCDYSYIFRIKYSASFAGETGDANMMKKEMMMTRDK